MRMRVIAWNVQPIVMADDGDNLTPISVQAQQILAANWESFKTGGDMLSLEGIRAEIEQMPSPESPISSTDSAGANPT